MRGQSCYFPQKAAARLVPLYSGWAPLPTPGKPGDHSLLFSPIYFIKPASVWMVQTNNPCPPSIASSSKLWAHFSFSSLFPFPVMSLSSLFYSEVTGNAIGVGRQHLSPSVPKQSQSVGVDFSNTCWSTWPALPQGPCAVQLEGKTGPDCFGGSTHRDWTRDLSEYWDFLMFFFSWPRIECRQSQSVLFPSY